MPRHRRYRNNAKLGTRVRNATRKLIVAAIYYGLMFQLGAIQAKAVLCPLCKIFLKKYSPWEFWMLSSLLSILFMVLNCLLVYACKHFLAPYMRSSRPTPSNYPNITIPKFTRSGGIYGYI